MIGPAFAILIFGFGCGGGRGRGDLRALPIAPAILTELALDVGDCRTGSFPTDCAYGFSPSVAWEALRCVAGGDPEITAENNCQFGNGAGSAQEPCQDGSAPNVGTSEFCRAGSSPEEPPEGLEPPEPPDSIISCTPGSDASLVFPIVPDFPEFFSCTPGTGAGNVFPRTCSVGGTAVITAPDLCVTGSAAARSAGAPSFDICFLGAGAESGPGAETGEGPPISDSQARPILDKMLASINSGWRHIDDDRRDFFGHSAAFAGGDDKNIYTDPFFNAGQEGATGLWRERNVLIKLRLAKNVTEGDTKKGHPDPLRADDIAFINNRLREIIVNHARREAKAVTAHIDRMATATDSYWSPIAVRVFASYKNADEWAMFVGGIGGASVVGDMMAWAMERAERTGLFSYPTPTFPEQ